MSASFRQIQILLALLLLSTPQGWAAQSDLVINEIFYAPADSKLEFVEILNASDQLVDLCTLSFADSRDEPVTLCGDVEQHVPLMLPPGSFAVIARDSTLLRQTFPLLEGMLVSPASWPALNNSGDTVTLYEDQTIIDRVVYLPAWGGARVSLERIDPAGPNEAFNWTSAIAPAGATPGYQNSVFFPDQTPPALLLAERTTAQTLTLFWNEPIAASLVAPSAFEVAGWLPTQVTALNDTTMVLHFDVLPGDATTLHIETVTDRTGNSTRAQEHPIAFLPGAGDLHINEIMFAPVADPHDNRPDQPEYVELYNHAATLLSLRHLTLAGEPDDRNVADSLQAKTPLPRLAPGMYAVYFAPGRLLRDKDTFLEAFPNLATSDPLLLPVPAASLGLRNEGDRVAIVQGHVIIDEVVYQPDWHHPLLDETRGIALERRSLNTRAAMPANWTSAIVSEGGTPGAVNSVRQSVAEANPAGQLVINPDLFSPDGDGVEDVLSIQIETEKASQAGGIKVYDLAGRRVRTIVETTLFQQQEIRLWDGTSDNGSNLPVGVYIVVVNLLDVSSGTTQLLKQPVILARQFR